MNPHLQKILDFVSKADRITERDKASLVKEIDDVGKAIDRERKTVASQGRALEIEAALERVRARAMAMGKSDELREVVAVLYEQMIPLGFATLGCELILCDEKNEELQYWSSTPEQALLPECYRIPRTIHPFFIKAWEAWKKQTPRFVYVNEGLAKRNFDDLIFEKTAFKNFPEHVKNSIREGKIDVFSFVPTKYGLLEAVDNKPLSEEKFQVLERFAKVFEQTYTRFLDLQKAEAQVREAEIELALERVRASTMAMHKTDELSGVIKLFFQQFELLGLTIDTCLLDIVKKGSKDFNTWIAAGTETYPEQVHVPFFKHPMFTGLVTARAKKEEFLVMELDKKSKTLFFDHFYKRATNINVPKKRKDLIAEGQGINASWTILPHANIGLWNYRGIAYNDEENDILRRMGKVFEQTYTRFLDLQKAEAQAREAQVVAALEKVRSQSMAMHTTGEMQLVANAVYEQLHELGLEMDVVGMSGVIETKQDYDVWVGGAPLGSALRIPYNEDTQVQRDYNKMLAERPELFARTYSGRVKKEYIDRLLTHGEFPPALRKKMENSDAFTTLIAPKKNSGIQVVRYTDQPFTEQDGEVLKRFAGVFEQAYIRFMDLEKAEAQAREAQIEMALEKVRSRTMAMHQSKELVEVATVLYNELINLQVSEFSDASIVIFDESNNQQIVWGARTESEFLEKSTMPLLGDKILQELYDNWHSGEPFFTLRVGHLALKDHNDFVFPIADRTEKEDRVLKNMPDPTFFNCAVFSIGYIELVADQELKEESKSLLIRFAKVFDQTFTRFLDLHKAEAQAREAQIEASLERIRARAMAMHASSELNEVLSVLFEQFNILGINPVWAHLSLINLEDNTFTYRMSRADKNNKLSGQVVDLNARPEWQDSVEAFKASKPNSVSCLHFPKEVLPQIWELFDESFSSIKDEYQINIEDFPDGVFNTQGFCRFGYIGFNHNRPPTEEEKEIVVRIANEFGRVYQRYLDIEKSEAQAREAQIEAALERVRSKTMAMHNSEDVDITVVTLFDEVSKLGLDNSIRCGIGILEGSENMETWSATYAPNGEVDLKVGMLDMTLHPLLIGVKNAWENGKKSFTYELLGKEKVIKYYTALNNAPEYPFNSDLAALPDNTYHNSFFFSSGILFAFTEHQISEESAKVLNRFASVFGQTYRRYLDLQTAEKQAREAQIEAALERVRSRSMAMQHSSELNLILSKVFEELTSLELEMERAVIWTYNPENRSVRWWAANPEAESGSESFFIADQDDPVYNEYWKAWEERRSKYLYILEGEYKENWTDILFNKTELGRLPEIVKAAMVKPERVYLYNTFNDFGVLFIACLEPLPEEKFTILERFGKVFDQSYTRFKDIKLAEARAKEAIKQSSLDRVRGQIASMRATADLDRITPLVWDELTALEVPFIRCGVFIIDETSQMMKAYLSSPQGESLGVLDLPFAASALTSNSVDYWREKKVLHQHWNKEEFVAWTESLMEQGLLKNRARYQGASEPPRSLDLHFVPFDQGMLYVGSEAALSPFQIELVQALANAFSVAYARYEDFVRLEKAKDSVEKTLSELKATQNQLVQSEKMASLGELTAGIAHEIQNPLNFVNNFSEVSKELLEEMLEELQNGNTSEVGAIADDVIQNLEKIVHHGKRADGIVKGMLQHSRSSSGIKEPTDINTLADEYLRLAYHGLRAKEKASNATLETHFDETIGEIDVIPQDMGRVILNLITNAFYVVKEKKEQAPEDYEPTVTVRTKNMGDRVGISVADNGNGIPQKVLDKIFQPFFTTKPTGEGTGLGLSMSYDIVTKGHGGALEVQTKEGKGSEFVITLPITMKP